MLHMYIYKTPQKVLLSHCESRKCKENRQSPDGCLLVLPVKPPSLPSLPPGFGIQTGDSLWLVW